MPRSRLAPPPGAARARSGTWPAVAVLVATCGSILAACGGLETPAGAVSGRIVGAAIPGAYAYPLGRPDLKASVQADGTFRMEGVPTTIRAFVLYDGFPAPNGRAELVMLAVKGGGEARIGDRFGAGAILPPAEEGGRMARAGTVLAAAMPQGGAIAAGPTFAIHGTDQSGVVPSSGGIVPVYPLPAGAFEVAAALPGFVMTAARVDVVAGQTTPAPVSLPIDLDATAPGCGSVPEEPRCENGLVCNPEDGRCYVCTAWDASSCGAGEACDAATGLCTQSGPGGGATCSACSADADCGFGVCVRGEEEPAGYCSVACAAHVECPAGFACSDSGRCEAPAGCDGWLQTMAATCVSGDRCEDALRDGRCERTEDLPGYCTARCRTSADCAVGSGVASTFVCAAGWCTPP